MGPTMTAQMMVSPKGKLEVCVGCYSGQHSLPRRTRIKICPTKRQVATKMQTLRQESL
jgi:hypothetical protein